MPGVTNVRYTEQDEILKFVDEEKIDLIIIGPEKQLVEGMANFFRSNGKKVFGFNKAAAALEGSKIYAKEFMKKYSIPTAPFEVFSSYKRAYKYLRNQFDEKPGIKFFIKADEICGGKGAIAAPDYESGKSALHKLMIDQACGKGAKVVIEEHIPGQEASIFVLTDGKTAVTLPPAQDHKRALDNDEGLNTGGMGAYAPAALVDEKVYARVEKEIILPTLVGMEQERIADSGILFIGLMIDRKGKPYVLEYNVRFGDPETQPLLSLLKSDLYPILNACAEGDLEEVELDWYEGAAVSVVASVSGYPTRYNYQNEEIFGIADAESLENVFIYHGDSSVREGHFFTNGGRIITVTGVGKDIKTAQKLAYKAMSKIEFRGMHYRKDIASKAL